MKLTLYCAPHFSDNISNFCVDDARTFRTSQFKVKVIFYFIPITLSEKEIITSRNPLPPSNTSAEGRHSSICPGAPKPRSVCTPGVCHPGYATVGHVTNIVTFTLQYCDRIVDISSFIPYMPTKIPLFLHFWHGAVSKNICIWDPLHSHCSCSSALHIMLWFSHDLDVFTPKIRRKFSDI